MILQSGTKKIRQHLRLETNISNSMVGWMVSKGSFLTTLVCKNGLTQTCQSDLVIVTQIIRLNNSSTSTPALVYSAGGGVLQLRKDKTF